MAGGVSPILSFSLFGVPVHIDGWYLLPMIWFGLQGASFGGGHAGIAGAFIVCLAVTLSLLVHEFGHVAAAALDGHRSEVILWGFGGVTIPSGESRGWRAVRLSLAGPTAGFALLAVTWFGFMPHDIGAHVRPWNLLEGFQSHSLVRSYVTDPEISHLLWAYLVWINLAWSLLNLLPVLPLDGGHALRDALRLRMRAYRADAIATTISVAVGGAAGVYFLLNGYIFAGAMLLYLAWSTWERHRTLR